MIKHNCLKDLKFEWVSLENITSKADAFKCNICDRIWQDSKQDREVKNHD